jgi:molybdenum cofactor guanylyltransferase
LASGAKTRVMDFARSHGAVRADFRDDGAFVNLNTPEDLTAAEAMLEARP